MENVIQKISEINDAVNTFVWVKVGLAVLLFTGVLMTVLTKFFQISHFRLWWGATIAGVFRKDSAATQKTDRKSISQFQALCTALAATIGTGNIVGVSLAIAVGGPGAVFWMWVAAFFGMMTNFSENVLGIYYRKKNKKGEWAGGPMYYLKYGLGGKRHCKGVGAFLAGLFSVFAILASFGIGNLSQINTIATNIQNAFFPSVSAKVGGVSAVALGIGVLLMVVGALIIIGGLQRIAAVAETVVPFMAAVYMLGAAVVVMAHIGSIGSVFASIFRFAFGIRAVAGAASGVLFKTVITQGFKRGVFSNEAGLGSSVMVHSSSNTKEPVVQGMWGIFEVFFDTIVVCTVTAIVVLSSGFIDLKTGLAVSGGAETYVARSFGSVFGKGGEYFIAAALLLFAFTTVLGWSQYGSRAVEYLFGETGVKIYKVVFVLMIVCGAVMTSSFVWDISDTFNGLMMIPNLIGVLVLSPNVMKITANYVDRTVKKKKADPLLSHHEEIQRDTHIAILEETRE